MEPLLKQLRQLHRDESGITTLEYLWVLVFVAIASFLVVALLGGELRELFADVHHQMSSGEIRGGYSAEDA